MTKLEQILTEREMSQGDLVRLIRDRSGFKVGRDRISKICTGRLTNYTMETAVKMAEGQGVTIDDLVELKDIKKENKG